MLLYQMRGWIERKSNNLDSSKVVATIQMLGYGKAKNHHHRHRMRLLTAKEVNRPYDHLVHWILAKWLHLVPEQAVLGILILSINLTPGQGNQSSSPFGSSSFSTVDLPFLELREVALVVQTVDLPFLIFGSFGYQLNQVVREKTLANWLGQISCCCPLHPNNQMFENFLDSSFSFFPHPW